MVNEVHPFRTPAPNAPIIWDGTDWRAIAGDTAGRVQVRGEDQLFSYKDRYAEEKSNINAAAGPNSLEASNVPAGEVWFVQAVSMLNRNTAATNVYAEARAPGAGVRFFLDDSLVADVVTLWNGLILLKAGDHIRVHWEGCSAGDELYMWVHGYKMTLET